MRQRSILCLTVGAALMAALTGCGVTTAVKNGAATAVDLAGHVTGYGWSTTVRGGLSAMGDLTGGTVKVYPNTTPAIFGDRYLTYLAAKKAMAIHMGAPNPQFRQDNATALVRGDEYLRSSMRPEFGDRFHLPLPYKGATEVRSVMGT